MASIDRRPGSEPTRVCAPSGALALRWILPLIAMAWSCLPPPPDIQCVESENCNRFSGGVCRSAPSGSRWCSYPDSECPSGYRFSDLDVGDGLSGACTETPGQPRWALQLGGTGWDSGNGITTDGDGNVIAVGTFSDSLSIGGVTLTSAGEKDLFVVKLDGYTGEVRWLKRFGDLDFEAGSAVRTDAANNIYVMGSFVESLDLGGGKLRSAGDQDLFVLKLSSAGEHVWSRQLGGVNGEAGLDLAVRGGRIAVVGISSQPFALDGDVLTHLGYLYTDAFIAMLATNGDLLWSKSVGGPRWDLAFGAGIDSRGDLVVVGDFIDTVDFGGLPLTSANGDSDVFVVKYAGARGDHLFSRSYGGPAPDKALAVTIDPLDQIVVVGVFGGTADFGGSNPLRAIGYGNTFVAKYTLAGANLWARSFHATSASGPGNLRPRSVTVDVAADIVLVGQFCGAISFGGMEISSTEQCSSSAEDAFAIRLAGSDGAHVSSVRAASRADMARISVASDGRLYLVGAFAHYAEIGGLVMTPVSSTDAFVLALAPL